MAVITKLLSSRTDRAMVYRPALPISNFPNRPTPSRLYTRRSLQLSTHASKVVTHQSLRSPQPPKREFRNQDESKQGLTWLADEDNLKLSEDKKPVDEMVPWPLMEEIILKDVRPMALFVRKILNSKRYKDCELLSLEDEIKIVEKLLPYHPRVEEKIGPGVDCIMVGRHREYNSRCLFIIQWNGRPVDFSYQKCLMGYIQMTYPNYAEMFISIHFKCDTYPLLKSSHTF